MMRLISSIILHSDNVKISIFWSLIFLVYFLKFEIKQENHLEKLKKIAKPIQFDTHTSVINEYHILENLKKI